VEKGQKLMTLYTDTDEKFERAMASLSGGVEYSEKSPEKRNIVLGKVG
jgi:thymidine phosphorylase